MILKLPMAPGAHAARACSLLLVHGRAATFDRAAAALGYDHLGTAFAADVNFAELICHQKSDAPSTMS